MTGDTRTEKQVGRHGSAVVNGPEDSMDDWLSVDWQQVEHDVGRLRQRIFSASQAGDLSPALSHRACLSPVRESRTPGS